MRKLAAFVLAAGLLLGGTARADDMYVPGLGTLPFSAAVQVKDGDGTAVEQMFRKSLAYPAAAGTKRAAFMRFLSTPEGMAVANGTAESPAAQSRLYQLVKEEPAGTYTMTVVVFSGDGDELFNARHKRNSAGGTTPSGRGARRRTGRRSSSLSMNSGKRPGAPWTGSPARPWISRSSARLRGSATTMMTAPCGGSRM